MYKYLSGILIVFVLLGCTPQKRLNRLLTNHSYLAKKDTFHIIDTVEFVTNRVEVDTVTSIESMRNDTFIVHRENLTIKTIIHKDSIYIWGQCDTIWSQKIIERQIPYDKFEYQQIKKWKSIIGWLVAGLIGLIILYILFKIFRKFLPF